MYIVAQSGVKSLLGAPTLLVNQLVPTPWIETIPKVVTTGVFFPFPWHMNYKIHQSETTYQKWDGDETKSDWRPEKKNKA